MNHRLTANPFSSPHPQQIPGIASVHELHVWRLDQHKAIASAHVVVAEPDVADFMAKAKTIRECLHAYGIHSTTLQPELYVPPRPSAPEPSATPGMGSVGGEDAAGGGGGGGGGSAAQCQIMCGKGRCDHLMCCNTLVQV
jgi:zinc transporter 1